MLYIQLISTVHALKYNCNITVHTFKKLCLLILSAQPAAVFINFFPESPFIIEKLGL